MKGVTPISLFPISNITKNIQHYKYKKQYIKPPIILWIDNRLENLNNFTIIQLGFQFSFPVITMPNKKSCPPCPGTSKVDLSELGITQHDLAGASDLLTGQSPITNIHSIPVENNPSKQREHGLLALLKNFWSQIEDPLDPKIIDVIEDLCDVVQDTRRSLLSKYRNLIQITGDDLSIIMDGILVDMTEGYKTLHASIKVAVISYSAAIARNARAALSDIATTATDLVTVAANSMAQYDAFKQSLDHISKSWNNTATSMTNYMGEVDKKLLVLNHLSTSLKSTRGPPSTDSRYSPDPIVGAGLVLVSGSKYRSMMGTLNFSSDESIGFIGSNNEGQLLGELIKALGKPKPIEKVLNKDLNFVNYLH